MPPIPPMPPPGIAGASFFFGASATMASVVIIRPATDAASCNATRTTFAGSTMPALSMRGLSVGQRVSGEGHVIGMRSRAARCRRYHLDPETRGIGVNIPGAFAEYVRVPAFNIVPLPDDVDDELGAILDPLGNAVHTALAFDLVGEDVLITGAGPIGIMAGAVARHIGARHVVITDVNPKRLKLATEVADVVAVDVSKEDLKATMTRLRMT